MLRYSLAFLWLSIVVAALSISIAGSTLSPSYQECAREQQQEQSTRDNGGAFGARLGIIVNCEAVFANENGAAITGIATVLLTVVTGLLGFLAWDQGRTSRAQMRAYIYVKPMRASLALDGWTVHVVAQTKNCGQTPSFETQIRWCVLVLPYPLTNKLVFRHDPADIGKPVPTFVVYPSEEQMTVYPYKLTAADVANIRGKTHALCAYGRVTYLDAFRTEQSGEFCAYIDGDVFDIWMAEALKSPDRQPIPAPFKFSQNNNTASF